VRRQDSQLERLHKIVDGLQKRGRLPSQTAKRWWLDLVEAYRSQHPDEPISADRISQLAATERATSGRPPLKSRLPISYLRGKNRTH
jgi:hypothetical protein